MGMDCCAREGTNAYQDSIATLQNARAEGSDRDDPVEPELIDRETIDSLDSHLQADFDLDKILKRIDDPTPEGGLNALQEFRKDHLHIEPQQIFSDQRYSTNSLIEKTDGSIDKLLQCVCDGSMLQTTRGFLGALECARMATTCLIVRAVNAEKVDIKVKMGWLEKIEVAKTECKRTSGMAGVCCGKGSLWDLTIARFEAGVAGLSISAKTGIMKRSFGIVAKMGMSFLMMNLHRELVDDCGDLYDLASDNLNQASGRLLFLPQLQFLFHKPKLMKLIRSQSDQDIHEAKKIIRDLEQMVEADPKWETVCGFVELIGDIVLGETLGPDLLDQSSLDCLMDVAHVDPSMLTWCLNGDEDELHEGGFYGLKGFVEFGDDCGQYGEGFASDARSWENASSTTKQFEEILNLVEKVLQEHNERKNSSKVGVLTDQEFKEKASRRTSNFMSKMRVMMGTQLGDFYISKWLILKGSMSRIDMFVSDFFKYIVQHHRETDIDHDHKISMFHRTIIDMLSKALEEFSFIDHHLDLDLKYVDEAIKISDPCDGSKTVQLREQCMKGAVCESCFSRWKKTLHDISVNLKADIVGHKKEEDIISKYMSQLEHVTTDNCGPAHACSSCSSQGCGPESPCSSGLSASCVSGLKKIRQHLGEFKHKVVRAETTLTKMLDKLKELEVERSTNARVHHKHVITRLSTHDDTVHSASYDQSKTEEVQPHMSLITHNGCQLLSQLLWCFVCSQASCLCFIRACQIFELLAKRNSLKLLLFQAVLLYTLATKKVLDGMSQDCQQVVHTIKYLQTDCTVDGLVDLNCDLEKIKVAVERGRYALADIHHGEFNGADAYLRSTHDSNPPSGLSTTFSITSMASVIKHKHGNTTAQQKEADEELKAAQEAMEAATVLGDAAALAAAEQAAAKATAEKERLAQQAAQNRAKRTTEQRIKGFSGTEPWKVRGIAIHMLLRLVAAIGEYCDTTTAHLAQHLGIAKRILIHREAMEHHPEARKAYDTDELAKLLAKFRHTSWINPKIGQLHDQEHLLHEMITMRKQLDDYVGPDDADYQKAKRILAKKEAEWMEMSNKTGNADVSQMALALGTTTVLYNQVGSLQAGFLRMEHTIGSSKQRQIAWEQEEEAIQSDLSERMLKLQDIRRDIDSSRNEPMRREKLMIAARETQGAIETSLANVKTMSGDIGVVFGFVGTMQESLHNFGGQLDHLSDDLKQLESRVFGRPPVDQIKQYRARELKQLREKMATEVYIPAMGKLKGEREPFFQGDALPLMSIIKEFLGLSEATQRKQPAEFCNVAARNCRRTPMEIQTLLIHGPAGSGKTTFSRTIKIMIMKQLEDDHNPDEPLLIPIFVNLPLLQYPQRSLVKEALHEQYKLQDTQVADLLRKVQKPDSMLRVVFLLDGVDEMAPEVRNRNLYTANRLHEWRPQAEDMEKKDDLCWPKVILLSRSELFSGQSDYQSCFYPSEPQNEKKDAEEYFAEIRIASFEAMVDAYIICHVMVQARKVFESVHEPIKTMALSPKELEERVQTAVKSCTLPNESNFTCQDDKELLEEDGNMNKEDANDSSNDKWDEVVDAFNDRNQSDQHLSKEQLRNRVSILKNHRKIMYALEHCLSNGIESDFTTDLSLEECKSDFDESYHMQYFGDLINCFETIRQHINNDNASKLTPSEHEACLAKLREKEILTPQHYRTRIGKIDGLPELTTTPFMVKITIDVIGQLHNMQSVDTLNTVEHNLVLRLHDQEQVRAAMDLLKRDLLAQKGEGKELWQGNTKDTESKEMWELSSMEKLELVQDELHRKADADLGIELTSKLRDIAKEVLSRSCHEYQHGSNLSLCADNLYHSIVRALMRKQILRWDVYDLFVKQYIKRTAKSKEQEHNTSMSLDQRQETAEEFSRRVAHKMTSEGVSKVHYEKQSALFNTASEWDEYFTESGERAESLKVVRDISPITQNHGAYSFIHKSVQEFLTENHLYHFLTKGVNRIYHDHKQLKHCLQNVVREMSSSCTCPDKETLECALNKANPNLGESACKKLSHNVWKFLEEVDTLEQTWCSNPDSEVALQDFAMDHLVSDVAFACDFEIVQHLLIIGATLGFSHKTCTRNIFAICVMPNRKRQDGNMLHVASKAGAIEVLQMSIRCPALLRMKAVPGVTEEVVHKQDGCARMMLGLTSVQKLTKMFMDQRFLTKLLSGETGRSLMKLMSEVGLPEIAPEQLPQMLPEMVKKVLTDPDCPSPSELFDRAMAIPNFSDMLKSEMKNAGVEMEANLQEYVNFKSGDDVTTQNGDQAEVTGWRRSQSPTSGNEKLKVLVATLIAILAVKEPTQDLSGMIETAIQTLERSACPNHHFGDFISLGFLCRNDSGDYKDTPLSCAARFDQFEACKVLLEEAGRITTVANNKLLLEIGKMGRIARLVTTPCGFALAGYDTDDAGLATVSHNPGIQIGDTTIQTDDHVTQHMPEYDKLVTEKRFSALYRSGGASKDRYYFEVSLKIVGVANPEMIYSTGQGTVSLGVAAKDTINALRKSHIYGKSARRAQHIERTESLQMIQPLNTYAQRVQNQTRGAKLSSPQEVWNQNPLADTVLKDEGKIDSVALIHFALLTNPRTAEEENRICRHQSAKAKAHTMQPHSTDSLSRVTSTDSYADNPIATTDSFNLKYFRGGAENEAEGAEAEGEIHELDWEQVKNSNQPIVIGVALDLQGPTKKVHFQVFHPSFSKQQQQPLQTKILSAAEAKSLELCPVASISGLKRETKVNFNYGPSFKHQDQMSLANKEQFKPYRDCLTGNAPHMVAARNGYWDVCKLLLNNFADLNQRDVLDGASLFSHFIRHNHKDAIDSLLKLKNAKDPKQALEAWAKVDRKFYTKATGEHSFKILIDGSDQKTVEEYMDYWLRHHCLNNHQRGGAIMDVLYQVTKSGGIAWFKEMRAGLASPTEIAAWCHQSISLEMDNLCDDKWVEVMPAITASDDEIIEFFSFGFRNSLFVCKTEATKYVHAFKLLIDYSKAQVHTSPELMMQMPPDMQIKLFYNLDFSSFVQGIYAKNPKALQNAPEILRNNPDIVKEALRHDGLALQFMTNETSVFSDKVYSDLVLEAVRQNGMALKFAKLSALDNDTKTKIVMTAVRKDGKALKFAGPKLKENLAVVLEAVQNDGMALQFAKSSVTRDKNVVMAAVNQNGMALQYANSELKQAADVVLAAVKADGLALKWSLTGESLDLMMEAVRQNGMALQHAKSRLRKSKDVVLTAVMKDGLALQYADTDLQQDVEIVMAAVKSNGMALQYATIPKENGLDQNWISLVKEAVKQDGMALQFATANMQQDCEVVLLALQQDYKNGHAFQYASQQLRADREFVLNKVLKKCGMAVQHVSEELLDKKIVNAALLQNGLALRYIPEKLHTQTLYWTAIRNDPKALEFVNEKFCEEDEYKKRVKMALKKDPQVIKYVSNHIRNNDDIMLEFLEEIKNFSVSQVGEELKRNHNFMLKACDLKPKEPFAVQAAHVDLLNNEEFMMHFVHRNGDTLQFASLPLQAEKAVVMAAIEQNGKALQHAGKQLQDNPEVVLAAVNLEPEALQYASERLKKDHTIVLAAVSKDDTGLVLRFASESLQKNQEIVKAAYKGNMAALTYAADDVKQDFAFMRDASAHDGNALEFISHQLYGNTDLVLTAIRQNGMALKHVQASSKDKMLVLTALQQNGIALQYATSTQKHDKEVVMAAVSQNGSALKYAGSTLKSDTDVVMAALKQNWRAMRNADIAITRNKEFILEFLSEEPIEAAAGKDSEHGTVGIGLVLQYLDEEMRADRDIVLECVKHSGMALQYANEALKDDEEICMAAVIQCGMALRCVSKQRRVNGKADPICVAAIHQDNGAAQFSGPMTCGVMSFFRGKSK